MFGRRPHDAAGARQLSATLSSCARRGHNSPRLARRDRGIGHASCARGALTASGLSSGCHCQASPQVHRPDRPLRSCRTSVNADSSGHANVTKYARSGAYPRRLAAACNASRRFSDGFEFELGARRRIRRPFARPIEETLPLVRHSGTEQASLTPHDADGSWVRVVDASAVQLLPNDLVCSQSTMNTFFILHCFPFLTASSGEVGAVLCSESQSMATIELSASIQTAGSEAKQGTAGELPWHRQTGHIQTGDEDACRIRRSAVKPAANGNRSLQRQVQMDTV